MDETAGISGFLHLKVQRSAVNKLAIWSFLQNKRCSSLYGLYIRAAHHLFKRSNYMSKLLIHKALNKHNIYKGLHLKKLKNYEFRTTFCSPTLDRSVLTLVCVSLNLVSLIFHYCLQCQVIPTSFMSPFIQKTEQLSDLRT